MFVGSNIHMEEWKKVPFVCEYLCVSSMQSYQSIDVYESNYLKPSVTKAWTTFKSMLRDIL